MSDQSKIEWCDSTLNPWLGCTKVSPACDHCYAESWAKRSGQVEWGPHADRKRTSDATWNQPFKWQRNADKWFAEHGRARRVFCASLADVFDKQVPREWRFDLFWLIESTPDIRWQILTKRVGNVEAMEPHDFFARNQHVGLMITVINQEEADRDVPKLLDLKARLGIRWVGLSCEPLLGPIDLREWLDRLDWVITGGESGPGARPAHPDWFRSLRDQCEAADVAFHFKQWGDWTETPEGRMAKAAVAPNGEYATDEDAWAFDREYVGCARMTRAGKKNAGRLLDGEEWSQFPEALR